VEQIVYGKKGQLEDMMHPILFVFDLFSKTEIYA